MGYDSRPKYCDRCSTLVKKNSGLYYRSKEKYIEQVNPDSYKKFVKKTEPEKTKKIIPESKPMGKKNKLILSEINSLLTNEYDIVNKVSEEYDDFDKKN